MINSRKSFSDEDYKYVSIVDINKLKEIFQDATDEYNPSYSTVVLYKGKTYILSIFTLEDKSINYSIIYYNKLKSKDKKFDSLAEFFLCLEELFLDSKFVVLNDIIYEDNEVIYYPVTTNDYLIDSLATRSDNVYKSNLPDCYDFKTTNKVFTLLLIFLIVNLFVGTVSIIYHVNIKDILLSIVAYLSATVSLVVILKCYTFKTSIVNGLINSSKLLCLNKTYDYKDIDYIDDVVYFNLFSTRKIYKIHMKDKRVVKIKYFNSSSSIIDDELNEMITYLREMFITNKIKMKQKEINNKLITIIAILLYAISIIIL